MTIYTPEQVAAADQLAHANGHLHNVLAHEPVAPGPEWDAWNTDSYQHAWRAHDNAEILYRNTFGAEAPNAFEVLRAARELVNPLRPTLAPGLWFTRDNRFMVGRYLDGHSKAHLLAVHFWEYTFLNDTDEFDPTVSVDAVDLDHAQQIVEQITWATTAGARPAGETA